MLVMLGLWGCASQKKIVDADNVIEREGIYYVEGESDPFSGEAVTYYDNGQLKSRVGFLNGKEHGKAILWYKNGQKESEMAFHNGKPHGKIVSWYGTGQKHTEGEYKYGEPIGINTYWYENGQKMQEIPSQSSGSYKIKRWDENGDLIQ